MGRGWSLPARDVAACAVFFVLFASAPAVAAQTSAFAYQGKLTDAGTPANGSYDLQFRLFDNATVGLGAQQGGTLAQSPVVASNGVFSVVLDFGVAVFDGSDRYVEIGVRPAGSANPYVLLSPRQQITSSPYAVQTLNATRLGGLPADRYLATRDDGRVMVGAASFAPLAARLNVQGLNGGAIYAECDACTGVNGYSGTGTGVFGESTGYVGVLGKSAEFEGVRGESWHTAHSGVTGWHNNSSGGIGVFGYSQAGAGIQGSTSTGNGAVGASSTGSGVYGESSAVSLTAGGVYGKNLSATYGIGVIGEANGASATGVYGSSTDANGVGVYGRNLNGTAVFADGDARQARASGGILKAMIEFDAAGGIVRCWNGVLALYSINCGISVSRPQTGYYNVDLGFQVTDRFVQVQPIGTGFCNIPATSITARVGNIAQVYLYCGGGVDRPFFMYVF